MLLRLPRMPPPPLLYSLFALFSDHPLDIISVVLPFKDLEVNEVGVLPVLL